MRAFFVLSVFSLLLISCRHDKENSPPSPSCDTVHVSYSTDVRIILQNNCYRCHSTVVTANGGLDLENWNSLKNYLTYSYRGDSIYGSKFFHIISQQGTVMYMPPTGKLSDCELAKIHAWLKAGAPQN